MIKPVGLRHVHRHEIHSALHQVGNEGSVARESVKAGNQQRRPALAAFRKRGVKLGPVGIAASAFNLGERGGKLLALSEEPPDALALRFETDAAHVLPVGRYSVVGHEIRHFPSGVSFANVGIASIRCSGFPPVSGPQLTDRVATPSVAQVTS